MQDFSVLNSTMDNIECPYCKIASPCRVKVKGSDSADRQSYVAKCLRCGREFSDRPTTVTTSL
jgi:transposase-like protein